MITADLQDAGWRVSQNTVAALMREQGLAARAHAQAQVHDPVREGPLAGVGPGQTRLRRLSAQP